MNILNLLIRYFRAFIVAHSQSCWPDKNASSVLGDMFETDVESIDDEDQDSCYRCSLRCRRCMKVEHASVPRDEVDGLDEIKVH